jgi:hypothetical protein
MVQKVLRSVNHSISAPSLGIVAVEIAIRHRYRFHAGRAACFDVSPVVANVDTVYRRDHE